MKGLWSEINAINDLIFVSENTITVKGRKFRVIDKPHDDPFRWLIAPVGWRYWWALVVYRLRQSFRRADWNPVTVPTWECIRPLRWLAHKVSMLKRAK